MKNIQCRNGCKIQPGRPVWCEICISEVRESRTISLQIAAKVKREKLELLSFIEDIIMHVHDDVSDDYVIIPKGEWEGSIKPKLKELGVIE